MSVCSKISGRRNYFAPAHVDYLSEVELPIVWDHQDTNDAYRLLPYDIKLALESKPIISKFADNWDLEVEKKNENNYFINYAEWIGRLIAGIDKLPTLRVSATAHTWWNNYHAQLEGACIRGGQLQLFISGAYQSHVHSFGISAYELIKLK